MKLESPVFKDQQFIPPRYTCDGENYNPPLVISGVPQNAKSLALIVDDPDVPMGTWVHWTMWDIPATKKEIPEHKSHNGAIEGVTSSGHQGYGGPCPPSGTHHYHFKLYALDDYLSLPASTTKVNLENAMIGHILGRSVLTGLYHRT